MEITRLRAFLRAHSRLALDTCIFIYQWEAHPRYSPLTDCIFAALEQSDFGAVTSTITMTELLVRPYRNGAVQEANEAFGLFSMYPGLEWVSPQLEIAALAAQMRGQYGLHTPDALQAATAIFAGATALITNDAAFKRMPNFAVLLLDDYL